MPCVVPALKSVVERNHHNRIVDDSYFFGGACLCAVQGDPGAGADVRTQHAEAPAPPGWTLGARGRSGTARPRASSQLCPYCTAAARLAGRHGRGSARYARPHHTGTIIEAPAKPPLNANARAANVSNTIRRPAGDIVIPAKESVRLPRAHRA